MGSRGRGQLIDNLDSVDVELSTDEVDALDEITAPETALPALIAGRLLADDVQAAGISVLTGGTQVHLVLVDLRKSEFDGQQAEDRLDSVGITVNRNAVPFDPRPPMISSGPPRPTNCWPTCGDASATLSRSSRSIAASEGY